MAESGFDNEERILSHAQNFLAETEPEDSSEYRNELENLSRHYHKLLRQSRKLMRISDRLQRQLSETNDALRYENEKNQNLQNIIQQYIPRNTWEKADLNSHTPNLEIPNEEVHRVCMFLDVVDFTRFSERRNPQEVMQSLNTIFQPVVELIHQSGGDIDKFIGDSIFAVYLDARSALETAIRIQFMVNSMQHLGLRIGINSGSVIIGNVGGQRRKDNTYMGDNVNIAARLQTHALPGGIMISRSCLDEAGLQEDQPCIYELPRTPLYVKGRMKPIEIIQIEAHTIQTLAHTLQLEV
ncbi:adenylate/guanylate cyclase domain-containing protein [Spirochaeta dissipatitropha]